MKVFELENGILLEDVKDFELPHIFECGQCFRWNREEDGSDTGGAFKKVINIKKEGSSVYIDNANIHDFKEIWYDYFDLGRDYGEIMEKLKQIDDTMEKSVEYGNGIRILKQDEWETLISFIISANNRIPMIKRVIENLSQNFGEYIGEYRGRKHYAFPEIDTIAGLETEDIKFTGIGFRGKYVISTARLIKEGELDIYNLKKLPTKDARKELMKLPGVGPKVADCIMLFSMDKTDSFPIDLWVRRVMEYFYLPKGSSFKDIQEYAREKFGVLAGFAQQYLFYYAREFKINKN